jgi:hypothetical protein
MSNAQWNAIYLQEVGNVRAALDWAFAADAGSAIAVALAGASASLWLRLRYTGREGNGSRQPSHGSDRTLPNSMKRVCGFGRDCRRSVLRPDARSQRSSEPYAFTENSTTLWSSALQTPGSQPHLRLRVSSIRQEPRLRRRFRASRIAGSRRCSPFIMAVSLSSRCSAEIRQARERILNAHCRFSARRVATTMHLIASSISPA